MATAAAANELSAAGHGPGMGIASYMDMDSLQNMGKVPFGDIALPGPTNYQSPSAVYHPMRNGGTSGGISSSGFTTGQHPEGGFGSRPLPAGAYFYHHQQPFGPSPSVAYNHPSMAGASFNPGPYQSSPPPREGNFQHSQIERLSFP